MKNKKLLLGIIALVAIGGTVFIATNNNSSPIANDGVYCSSDGMFTDTMPIQSHRSYCIKSERANSNYSFSIIDDRGDILKDFEITHTKIMHVIVVRKDLANFQHLHPEFNKEIGLFTLKDHAFPTDGEYRIFADFVPSGQGMPLGTTIYEDITVGTGYKKEPIGSEEKIKTFDGYQVALETHGALRSGQESMLMFNISKNGKPVTDLQEYLGALGHSVILREGTLDFIHVHPMEQAQPGRVDFMAHLHEPGKYKVFTQFQHNGKIITTDFVINVK